MPDGQPASQARGDRDAEILSLLRSTHKAWRTLSVPGLVFPEDRALPVDDFVRKYLKAWKDALRRFWQEFAPFGENEFVFNFYFDNKIWYFLTSERLILWDTARSSHWNLPLRGCLRLTPSQKRRFVAQMSDGTTIEIVSASVFFSLASRLTQINPALAWANSQDATMAASMDPSGIAKNSPESTPYVADQATVPLRSLYAKKGAAWATSIPTLIWVMLLLNSGASGSGVIFLWPGLIGVILLGLLGYAFGYAFGSLKDRKLRTRQQNATNRPSS